MEGGVVKSGPTKVSEHIMVSSYPSS